MAAVLRRHLHAGLGALVLLGAGGAPASAQGVIEADRVIAAFLLRFPQFVEWPEAALEGRETFDICVAEPDPFGEHLDEMVEDEHVDGRRLVTRQVNSPRALAGCQILYLSSVSERASALLDAAEGRPVLTIGESSHFLDEGGVINLLVGPQVRFEINVDAAARAGLTLSSQLLGLAVSVRGSG